MNFNATPLLPALTGGLWAVVEDMAVVTAAARNDIPLAAEPVEIAAGLEGPGMEVKSSASPCRSRISWPR
jgi:hypothetical protein